MGFENYLCSQCGAKNFTEEGKDKLRCCYCTSLFFIENSNNDFGVTIQKGAKIEFESTANVLIIGKLEIEDGAEVRFDGKITLIEKSSDDKIKKAKLKLKE